MYKQLKKKLILMYWLTSVIILTVVLGSILYMTVNETIHKEFEDFETMSSSYVEQFQGSRQIKLSWIKQIEQENHWYLQVKEEKVDLELPNTYTYDGDLSKLFESVEQSVSKQDPDFYNLIDLPGKKLSQTVKVKGEDDYTYYGRMYQIKTNRGLTTMMVIQQIEPVFNIIGSIFGKLLAGLLVGSILLFLLSFSYVRYAVRPVEEANQKQKEFIASVSHELKSPLAVFQVGLDSMKKKLEDQEDKQLKGYLYPMEGECMRMKRLIEDMLLLAATDQKTWTIRKDRVDMEVLLIDCYDAFCMMNQEVQDKIHIDLSEENLPEVLGDEDRIKQVIMILLDNAMSYTDISEGIVLRAYKQEQQVVIEVEDHGEGMSDEDKHKVFERFYRRDESRSSRNHFGLGLSIAKRLVELHHGGIEVKDTVGHGSTFVVWLPIQEILISRSIR